MPRTNGLLPPPARADPDVTIRRAREEDADALIRLATLDSRLPLIGACLVADVGGTLWAATSLPTGDVAADPFRATDALVALLHQRARHLRQDGATPRTGGLRWLLGNVPRRQAAR